MTLSITPTIPLDEFVRRIRCIENIENLIKEFNIQIETLNKVRSRIDYYHITHDIHNFDLMCEIANYIIDQHLTRN